MRRKGIVGMAAAAAVVALVVAGALVARTGTGTGSDSSVSSDRAARPTAAPAIGEAAPAVGGAGSGVVNSADAKAIAPPVPGQSVVAPTGPRIVRTAEVSVKVGKDGFQAAFDRVTAIATMNGGYVTASSTASDASGASGTGSKKPARPRAGQLTLRTPAGTFDDVRRAVGQLGMVEQESSQGEDVSGQLVDYDARLRSLQAQEDSLRTLLGKAANVGEVLQVQNSLFSVRQQIEQLSAQRQQLDQVASLATLQVSLYEPGAALAPNPEPLPAKGLAHSFQRAVDGTVEVVGGMVVVVGWLTPIAVLAGLAWGGYRLRKRPGKAAPALP